MSNIEQQYLNILRELIDAPKQDNRTGESAHKLPPQMLQHDMSEGFPILTTKFVAWKTMKVELEGFIKGITSKKWYKDRGCNIWNQWCSPQKIPYSTDPNIQKLMEQEDDLGECLYGGNWRGFKDPMATVDVPEMGGMYTANTRHVGQSIDQLQNIVNTLKSNPEDRRMICLAWNPLGMKHTALPACHTMWQVTTRGNKLDLTWNQRSVDTLLGLPFNLASYGLLLHLLAKEAGLEVGILTGFLCDVHLYGNHIEQAKEQLSREIYNLPNIKTDEFKSIFDWIYEDTKIENYKYHPAIKAPVAV